MKKKIKNGKNKKTERNKLLIKTLNQKFKTEGFNDTDLTKRGIAYRALNKNEKTLADFEEVIKLNPENQTAIVQKATRSLRFKTIL